jgi:hypothetical protein
VTPDSSSRRDPGDHIEQRNIFGRNIAFNRVSGHASLKRRDDGGFLKGVAIASVGAVIGGVILYFVLTGIT